MGMGMIIDLLEAGGLLALATPNGNFYYAQKVDTKRLVWDFVTNGEASTVDGHTGNPAEAVVVLLKSNDQKFIGFRSHVAEGKILQATKDKGLILRFSNQNFDSWEQWAVYGESLNNCVLVNRKFPDKRFHVAFHKVLPVLESSLEAMKAQLVRAQAEAAASKSKHEESDKRITELEAQIVNGNSSEAASLGGGPWEVQVKALEGQIEELEAELKKSKELVALCPVAALVSPPHNSSAESLAANVDEDYNILVGKEQQKKTMTHLWSELNKTEIELEEAKATAANLREMLTAAVEKATDLEKKEDGMKECSKRCLELETLLTVYQVREKDVEDKLVSSQARVAELECELNASKERIIAIEDRASHHESSAKEESIAQTLELERVLSLHQSQAHHATEAMLKLESKVRELEWELQTAAAELENHPEALEHQGQIAATHQVEEDKDNTIDVLEDVATKQTLELDIIWVLHESQMKEVSARLTGLAARIVELEKELRGYVVKESKQARRLEAVEEIIAQRDETVRQLCDNAMELQGLIAAHRSSSEEKSNCIALLQANVKKLEMEISSSQDQATLYEDHAKHLAERSLELEKLLSEHQCAAQNAAESAASLQDVLLVAHNANAEMNADMTEMGRKLSLLEVQCCEAEEKASQKAAEVDTISARMHLSNSKLKDVEATNMELHSRVVTLQERVDSAEAQYRTVLESLAKSREELGHLQTFTAQLTHEKQQLEIKMTSLMEQNTSLTSQMAVLQGQLQENQTKLEADGNALKRKSFHEVTLEGELQALRAQASELTLLRSQLSVSENKLHEAEAKQHQQNMSLVQLTAAQQEILSLKDNLINHSSHKEISQLQGIITSLEDKLKTTETEKSKLESDYKELLCNMAEVKENGRTSETGLLIPSSNVNQPKANSTQEGVKSIVAQTGKTWKRKPKMDKSTDEQTAVEAALVTEKVEKPVCQHKASLSLLAVLIAIALALLIIYF
ncbi:unnamed protein product [Sphagnum troendelagicum]|uniref:Uncharacterized protein n=1 Tax=Sphagnum troendelagicum TaxID=128251 RepID=A0ABP0URP4_9BRYO